MGEGQDVVVTTEKKASYFSRNWVSRIEVSVRFPQGFKTSFPGCGSQWKRKARKKPSSSLCVYSLFLFIWGLITLFLFVGSFVQNQFNLIYILSGLCTPRPSHYLPFLLAFLLAGGQTQREEKGPYFKEVWQLNKATLLAKLRNGDFPWNFNSLCPSISH